MLAIASWRDSAPRSPTDTAFATAVAVLDFAASLPLWFSFDRGQAGYQFVEHASWIPSLGVSYHFGIDGITLVLL